MSCVCEFVEGESRPLCCLHGHEVTRCSTVDSHMYSCVERVVSKHTKAPSNGEQSRMFGFRPLDADTHKFVTFFGFVGTDGGVKLFSRKSS